VFPLLSSSARKRTEIEKEKSFFYFSSFSFSYIFLRTPRSQNPAQSNRRELESELNNVHEEQHAGPARGPTPTCIRTLISLVCKCRVKYAGWFAGLIALLVRAC